MSSPRCFLYILCSHLCCCAGEKPTPTVASTPINLARVQLIEFELSTVYHADNAPPRKTLHDDFLDNGERVTPSDFTVFLRNISRAATSVVCVLLISYYRKTRLGHGC